MRYISEKSKDLQISVSEKLNRFLDTFQAKIGECNIYFEGYSTDDICESEIYRLFTEGDVSNVISSIKGSYIIIIFDNNNKHTYIANDLLSKRPLYYYYEDNIFIANSSYLDILRDLKERDIKIDPDYMGLKEISRHGSFLFDHTYYKQIKFLMHNQYIDIDENGSVSVVDFEYIRPTSIPTDEEKLIEFLDNTFKVSCASIVKKNASKGYTPVFSISGGMDSRCTFLSSLPYCKEYTTEVPLTFSYGRRGCKDLEISSSLADNYHCDYFEHIINYDSYLLDRDQMLVTHECQVNYSGSTGLYRVAKHLDNRNIGVVMTGLAGGELFGDLRYEDGEVKDCDVRYRRYFAPIYGEGDELEETIKLAKSRYKSYNEFVVYNDIRANQNFAYTARGRFEVYTPFLDEEIFTAITAQSYDTLKRRRLYTIWYTKCFSDDTPVTYSYYKGKIRLYKTNVIYRKIKSVIRVITAPFTKNSKWTMTPDVDGILKSEKTREYFEKTIQNDYNLISLKDNNLADFIKSEYDCAGISKTRILTASAVYKYYSVL